MLTYSSTIKRNKEFRLLITIHTYVQSSLVLLAPVTALFGEVKLLLGFTQTSPKSMPSVYATACATCNKLPCCLLPALSFYINLGFNSDHINGYQYFHSLNQQHWMIAEKWLDPQGLSSVE
jgi:hypothetical protein